MRPENVQVNRFDPLPAIKCEQVPAEELMDTVSSSTNIQISTTTPQVLSSNKTEADSSTSPQNEIAIPKPVPLMSQMPDLFNIHQAIGAEPNPRETVIMNSALEAKAQMASIFNRVAITNSNSLMKSMLISYERLVQKRNIFRMTMCNQQKSLSEIFNSLSTSGLTVTSIEKFDCNEHVTSCKFEVLLFAEFCMELKYFSTLTIEQKVGLKYLLTEISSIFFIRG
uniref:Uncharacterized protein n=1 Tax=Acrobeloides nanus TaxID=290746 RepID=A0A914E6E0_9BILA